MWVCKPIEKRQTVSKEHGVYAGHEIPTMSSAPLEGAG